VSDVAKSLRDQLVASGLASASKARKAEKQLRAEAQARDKRAKDTGRDAKRAANSGATPSPEPTAKQRAQRARAEKARRDREMAQAGNSKAATRALRAQIKQLIAQNDQREKTQRDDDVAYNFLHNKKIKRIYVPPKQVDQLSKGALVIINDDGLYHLVSKEIAEKIALRDPRRIITSHGAEEEMDEAYKDFKVPDDLDW
jgi:hypothetical protein